MRSISPTIAYEKWPGISVSRSITHMPFSRLCVEEDIAYFGIVVGDARLNSGLVQDGFIGFDGQIFVTMSAKLPDRIGLGTTDPGRVFPRASAVSNCTVAQREDYGRPGRVSM